MLTVTNPASAPAKPDGSSSAGVAGPDDVEWVRLAPGGAPIEVVASTTATPLAVPIQLLAQTIDAGHAGALFQPWPLATQTPTHGVLVQLDRACIGMVIEVGPAGFSPGNGIQLGPGDTDMVTTTSASTIWIVGPQGAVIRGQIR